MRRRHFLALVYGPALAALPRIAVAQPTRRIPRIGVLVSYAPEDPNPADSVREGLRELGYVEGRNIIIEWRSARGKAEQFPQLAAELVALKVNVIVAGTNPSIHAAHEATRTIPIVMGISSDPISAGFVSNLSRPGGNITGISLQSEEISSKRIQLFKELLPKLSRLAILWTPEPTRANSARVLEEAVRAAGLQVQLMAVRNQAELEGVFKEIRRQHIDAAVVSGSTLLYVLRQQIAALAAKNRMPVSGPTRTYAEAGLLMSYGANFADAYRRTAFYVDKILKGANPGDLAVEQPTKFELFINLKTAKAIGVKVPTALTVRADKLIE